MEEIRISVGGNSPRPRMSTGSGVAPESVNMEGDVRATVESIYEMLKVILSRLDENMPYITRACDRDGGK